MSPDLDQAVSRAHRPLSAAVVAIATIGAGALWLILSMTTGLIFHFMPGASILAAVWVRRAYGPDVPIHWRSLWAHLAGGIGVTVVIAIIIAKAGGASDAVWLIGAAVLAGTGLAIWMGRRQAGDDARGSGRPMELDDGPPTS